MIQSLVSAPVRIRILFNTSKNKTWNMSKNVYFMYYYIVMHSKNNQFFSALTLGLKKDDMGFMPVLSTLARLFWAADIFFGGWNREIKRDKVNITWQPWGQQAIEYISKGSMRTGKGWVQGSHDVLLDPYKQFRLRLDKPVKMRGQHEQWLKVFKQWHVKKKHNL